MKLFDFVAIGVKLEFSRIDRLCCAMMKLPFQVATFNFRKQLFFFLPKTKITFVERFFIGQHFETPQKHGFFKIWRESTNADSKKRNH